MAHKVAPIAGVTRREAVLSELRDAILTGRLAPGDKLREVQLSQELGVSRPTLREAIYQLIHEGLLVQEDFKGVTVASLDRAMTHDVAAVRNALESIAARSIAAQADNHSREALRSAWVSYQAAAGDGDPSKENEAHLRLHETIWMQSSNSLLHRIWPIVSAPIQVAMANDLASQAGDTERNLRMHRELVEAILSNDIAGIDEAVRSHIEGSARLLEAAAPSGSPTSTEGTSR